ncbi:MAG: hypothetical protein IJ110_01420 [Lachnospiraceae bacterium]|nr:hypothetical protein [Lachnospiraceae bacterium]
MITGKTESGFEFQIDEDLFNDMELLDRLVDADKGNYRALSDAISCIMGKDQKQKLYDHVRTESGRVPIKAVANEFREILSLSGSNLKNSSSSPM